jgi:hypothetical protein
VCERRGSRRRGVRASRSVNVRESVLLIGTQFSNLYTTVDTPAKGHVGESHPKPRPKPNPSSADVAERGVASISVHSLGNLCVEEEYVYREADGHSTTPTYTVIRGGPAREPRWSEF